MTIGHHSGNFLANQLLIAMPALDDPNFARSVTYLCQHDDEGAMGISISKPASFQLNEVLNQMHIQTSIEDIASQPVFLGGPVQSDRGFVLHEECGAWFSSVRLPSGLCLTTSRDLLEAIAEGQGPKRFLVALGYAGWGEGQLEQEILQNSWLNAPLDQEILFSVPAELRWQRATDLVGVKWQHLTGYAGHA